MSHRNAMLAKAHIAKKDLALDDASYRALLRRVAGADSAAACTDRQLDAVLAEFRRLGWKAKRKRTPKRTGARPLHRENEAPKIRALWLSLYHLGEIADPSEAALARFAARMTRDATRPDGIEALQFLDAPSADRVVKALRGWCARAGFAQPGAGYLKRLNLWREAAGLGPVNLGVAAKVALMEAQWARLRALGALRAGAQADLGAFLAKHFGAAAPHFLDAEGADRAIERLGAWVRRAKAAAASCG